MLESAILDVDFLQTILSQLASLHCCLLGRFLLDSLFFCVIYQIELSTLAELAWFFILVILLGSATAKTHMANELLFFSRRKILR